MTKNLDFISKEFENILVKFSLAKLLATGEVPVPIYTTGVNLEVAEPKVKHPPTRVTKEFKNKLLVVKIPQYLIHCHQNALSSLVLICIFLIGTGEVKLTCWIIMKSQYGRKQQWA